MISYVRHLLFLSLPSLLLPILSLSIIYLSGIYLSGCGGSSISDIIDDVAKEPDRKPIDTTRLGTNSFFNNSNFGSIGAQAKEVKETLRLNFVRVLFAWNDQVQPTPGSAPNFSFYDDIVSKASARDLDILVVITGLPSWMTNGANWSTEGNPRKTFIDLWAKKVFDRYAGNAKVSSFQIWNEPNMQSDSHNVTLDIAESPINYLEMLCYGYSVAQDTASSKLIVSAATTAINQNYPQTLDYNKTFHSNGAENCLDIYGLHVYGKQFENFVRGGGINDFFGGVKSRVWVTESGAQGVNSQLPYGEQMWPYIMEKISQIERIYQYQFAEATPSDVTYGLRNLTAGSTLSDLYIFLRDR